jgi:hypothetical protein
MIQGLLLTFMRFHLLVGWYPILRETPNSRAKPCLGSKFLSPDRSWRSWRGYNPLAKSIEAWFSMQNHLNLSYIITTDQIRTATRPLSKYPAARPLQRSWSAATGVQTCEVAGWSKFLEGPRGKLTQIWNIHGFSMGNDQWMVDFPEVSGTLRVNISNISNMSTNLQLRLPFTKIKLWNPSACWLFYGLTKMVVAN